MTVEEMVGQKVREKREQVGITQEELGKDLGEFLGQVWSRQSVSVAENGGRDWRAVDLIAVAQVLRTTVGWLTLPSWLSDEIEFPSKTVSAEAMMGLSVSMDTPPLDAAGESLALMLLQLEGATEQLEDATERLANAKEFGAMVGAMFVRQERADTHDEGRIDS